MERFVFEVPMLFKVEITADRRALNDSSFLENLYIEMARSLPSDVLQVIWKCVIPAHKLQAQLPESEKTEHGEEVMIGQPHNEELSIIDGIPDESSRIDDKTPMTRLVAQSSSQNGQGDSQQVPDELAVESFISTGEAQNKLTRSGLPSRETVASRLSQIEADARAKSAQQPRQSSSTKKDDPSEDLFRSIMGKDKK